MVNKPFKIGFIGGGINSVVGNTHKIASQMDNCWQLVAGCFSKHIEINIETAETWGVDITRVYTDWREFLKKEQGKVDAVAVITPTRKDNETISDVINQLKFDIDAELEELEDEILELYKLNLLKEEMQNEEINKNN